MTSISFEEDISLARHKFRNIKDFFIFTLENYNFNTDKVEFWNLEKSEISEDLLQKISKAKSSQIHFNNI